LLQFVTSEINTAIHGKENMLVQKGNYLRAVAMVLLMVCNGALAKPELEPAGLAVYTETARDIYIAALLLPSGASLDSAHLAAGPKAMEYRITTRRISSRGFSGTLLLQSELGAGSRAPETALAALKELKPRIKGALKQGDHFTIALSEPGDTIFYLNGNELLAVAGADVFDFFLAGWVGENSSAMLRDSLLAGSLDVQLKARYEATQPTAERIELVVSWQAPPPQPPAKPAPVIEKVAEKSVATMVAKTSTAPVAPPTTSEPAQEAGSPAVIAATTKASVVAPVKNAAEPSTIAVEIDKKLAATSTTLDSATAEPVLDDREYQRQLGEYVTVVMQTVYKQVKYPRRAVDKSQQGKVELLAYFDATGELLEVVMDNSSGYTTLDRAAERAVLNAAPFPKLSKVAQEEFINEDGSNYVMPIPITFRLQ